MASSQDDIFGKGRYQRVRLDDLTTDPSFNRPLSESGVDHIAVAFNAPAFGIIHVWQRDDGVLVIVDGQHRCAAARRVGVPVDAKCIPAIVYAGLTVAEVAELFLTLNDSKKVGPLDRFHAELTAGRPITHAINQMVMANGLRVGKGNDATVGCVAALHTVYGMGDANGAVLGRTLAALHRAWGPIREAYAAVIVRGVGRYLHEHPDVDPGELGYALVHRTHGGAPINLLAKAKQFGGSAYMPLDVAIAQVIARDIMPKRRTTKPVLVDA
jgi:hypothetical protein